MTCNMTLANGFPFPGLGFHSHTLPNQTHSLGKDSLLLHTCTQCLPQWELALQVPVQYTIIIYHRSHGECYRRTQARRWGWWLTTIMGTDKELHLFWLPRKFWFVEVKVSGRSLWGEENRTGSSFISCTNGAQTTVNNKSWTRCHWIRMNVAMMGNIL